MPLGRTKRDAKKRIQRQMDKAQKKFYKKLPQVKGKNRRSYFSYKCNRRGSNYSFLYSG